jgi:hypothetical protein
VTRSRIAVVVCLVFAACGELPAPQRPDGLKDPTDEVPGDDIIDETPPAAPNLDSTPARYGYDTMPVRGYAEASASVFVEGGIGPVAGDADFGGRFCLDVPLNKNVLQTLEVFAMDGEGLTSAGATLTVRHDPSLAESEPQAAPVINLALGKNIIADADPKEGLLPAVTDNDPTTAVVMAAGFIWIDLGGSFPIETIELVFPATEASDDDTFATEYILYTSSQTSPTVPPYDGAAGWAELADVYPGSMWGAGDGGTDTFEMDQPMQVRFIAVYLLENNMIDWFDSENIRLAELRVLGRDDSDLPDTILTPTCANGAPLD